MSYARNKLLNKQLPAYLGFVVMLVALGITIFLSGNTYIFVSKAAAGSDPKNIQISNISPTSFTVSYTTDETATGSISYGIDPTTPEVALDDRDQQASGSADYQIHYITVKNLTPATKYYFSITSGSQKVENSGNPFIIATLPTLQNPPTGQPTLSGTVALSSGSVPPEGIVYVSATNTLQLATLINPDGSYQIPLNQMLDSNASSAASLTPTTVLTVEAVTDTQQSTAKVLVSQAGQVPKIILPQDYDFTLGPTQPTPVPSGATTGGGFPALDTPSPVSSPEITTPTDQEAFSDQQPLFQGRAIANTEVDILIQSQQEISVKLQSDNTGSWEFRPPIKLAPGNHTITIKSVDTSGILQTIMRSFTVYASGSKFVEPSVSPIATTPSPTVQILPTGLPTPTTAPTSNPTPTPTQAVTPTQGPIVTPIPTRMPVPKTGSSAVVTGTIAGLSILSIGALLFFAL
jgi:hypothetical protein